MRVLSSPNPRVERIGIFGGTFNPIHSCHLQIARETRKRMRLHRVIFVPSGQPPHKPERGIQTPRDRLEMVQLAIADEPYFSLSAEEIHRAGKSYAIETLATFKRRYSDAQIFFIVGIDVFLEIGSWKAVDRLMELCHFIVVSRYGFSFEQLEEADLPVEIDRSTLLALDRGHARKRDVLMKKGMRLYLLRIPPCKISSTEIRQRLTVQADMKKLLPEAVKSYILKNRLYRGEGVS